MRAKISEFVFPVGDGSVAVTFRTGSYFLPLNSVDEIGSPGTSMHPRSYSFGATLAYCRTLSSHCIPFMVFCGVRRPWKDQARDVSLRQMQSRHTLSNFLQQHALVQPLASSDKAVTNSSLFKGEPIPTRLYSDRMSD